MSNSKVSVTFRNLVENMHHPVELKVLYLYFSLTWYDVISTLKDLHFFILNRIWHTDFIRHGHSIFCQGNGTLRQGWHDPLRKSPGTGNFGRRRGGQGATRLDWNHLWCSIPIQIRDAVQHLSSWCRVSATSSLHSSYYSIAQMVTCWILWHRVVRSNWSGIIFFPCARNLIDIVLSHSGYKSAWPFMAALYLNCIRTWKAAMSHLFYILMVKGSKYKVFAKRNEHSIYVDISS